MFLYLTELPTIFLLNGNAPSLSNFLKFDKPIPSSSAASFMSIKRGISRGLGLPCSARLVNCEIASLYSGRGITPSSAIGRIIRLNILTVSIEIFSSFILTFILSASLFGRGCPMSFFVKNNCCNPLYKLYQLYNFFKLKLSSRQFR